MTTELILDPPSAVAVGKCLMARIWRAVMGIPSPDAFHPRPCAWEDYSRSDLDRMLRDFNDAAGYDARWERYRNIEVERFHALSRPEQARLVRAAQYPEGATA